jgi:hypothetical protein
MVFADGEVFVGIAPLGRVRKMEDIETLLKVSLQGNPKTLNPKPVVFS